MSTTRPFEIAFLTSFSDTCFRAIPGVARMCDDLQARLTLVHAHDPQRCSAETANARLRGFFPEADGYEGSRRVLWRGTPADAVRQLQQDRPIDLLVAPASDATGLARLARRSVRSGLLRERIPALWTVGPESSPATLARAVRTVACCLPVGEAGHAHVRLASRYAAAMGAALHLVHVLPEVHDGSLLRLAYAPSVEPRATVRRMGHQLVAGAPLPRVHVTRERDLVTTLEESCLADVVFVQGESWVRRPLGRRRLATALDQLRRPVFCVTPSAADADWTLTRRDAGLRRPAPALVRRRGTDREPLAV